ncbi:MAG: hypothetical protein AB8D78_09720 [Akkermansiaceae bacterium]
MRVVLAWALLMVGLVVLREYLNKNRYPDGKVSVGNEGVVGTFADEKVALLNKALPECHRTLAGFLSAGTPEARNQFVIHSVETAGEIATFYRSHSFPKTHSSKLKRTAEQLMRVDGTWLVFTRWTEDTPNGVEFDAVFQQESGSWKLDWYHFSRYSEYPWQLFLAGDGPDEATFRLLARRIVRGGRDSEEYGARMSIALVDPRVEKENLEQSAIAEIQVDRRSDAGFLLEAGFESKSRGRTLFGADFSSAIEPEGLIRVRVKVRREELGRVRRFEIEEVAACHWVDTRFSGFDLEVLRNDLFGGR